MKKVGNKEDIIEYGAYLIVSASSVNQLRQRRQVVLNYFDDMGVEISEASQDAPYLFQAYSTGKTSKRKLAPGHIWSQPVGFQNSCPTNTTSETVSGWYIGRVDNWTAVGTLSLKLLIPLKYRPLQCHSRKQRRYRWKDYQEHISLLRVRQDKENLSSLRLSFLSVALQKCQNPLY